MGFPGRIVDGIIKGFLRGGSSGLLILDQTTVVEKDVLGVDL